MLTSKNKYLFLVVLGGRAKMANIELHDVRWVVGSRIEDTYDVLRKDWFGLLEGLHIDSYKKVNYVDGYKINLKNLENKKLNKNKMLNKNNTQKNLYFVNIGGYDPTCMQEKHEFGLVVASSNLEAKNKAKSKWLNGCKKKHKDDIHYLKNLIILDDCELIEKIGNWEIHLIQDNNFLEETNYPDWYGYKRIDKI
jgi:Ni,Fe-hydrogenase I large subunit